MCSVEGGQKPEHSEDRLQSATVSDQIEAKKGGTNGDLFVPGGQ
jgi:hypothetical protein